MIGSLMIYLSQLMKLNIDQEMDNSKKIQTYLTFFIWTDLIISGVFKCVKHTQRQSCTKLKQKNVLEFSILPQKLITFNIRAGHYIY